jgi:pimeloyl-ACP methyl ester carboxylesterase
MDLVFIHGAADSGAVWERQVRAFDLDHRVLAVDLPGHGRRLDEPAVESCARSAEDVLRQVEREGFQAPLLVGHSMGGAIAMTIALAHSELPSALVLAGSGARLRIRPEVIDAARERAETAPRGQRIERVIPLDEVVSPNAADDLRAWLEPRIGEATGQATHADFVATSSFDVMGRLGEIRLPTLVIGGEDDRWTPPKFHHYLAEHIPGARLVMFPDCGHYPFAEHADRFNAELARFIAQLAPAAAGQVRS